MAAAETQVIGNLLTLSPQNKLSSVTFFFCFNIQRALKSLKIWENVVQVSNSLDPDKTAGIRMLVSMFLFVICNGHVKCYANKRATWLEKCLHTTVLVLFKLTKFAVALRFL